MNFRRASVLILAVSCSAATLSAQNKLSPKWEELTAPDFRDGVQQAKGTCLLPFGILEKHSQHLPLGTDLLNVRYASLQAVSQEYAVVFPEYYFGQIFEAKHEPGTVAYSMDLQLHLLQETTDEMARNGCKKIIIVNGHGGNEHLLPFFAQAQLDKPHGYVVYVLDGERSRPGGPAKKIHRRGLPRQRKTKRVKTPCGFASGSCAFGSREKRIRRGPGSAWTYRRICIPEFGGYARVSESFIRATAPVATKELGEWNMKGWVDSIVECIRAVKADDASLKIQNDFYEKSKHPLDTRP